MRRIAVDVDGVLSDVAGHILPILNEKYGTNYKYDDVNCWDFLINGVSIGKYMKEYFFNQDFLLTTPEIDGAKEAIEEISKENRIVIATGRPEYTRGYTHLWLNGRFVFDKVVFTNKKTVQSTGCDILIDDYSKYINDFSDSGGKTIQLLQPWNKDYISEKADYVATKWNEIPGLINSI